MKHIIPYPLTSACFVDNEEWSSVIVSYSVAKWIREQDCVLWYEHQQRGMFASAKFDIHNELLLITKLKYE